MITIDITEPVYCPVCKKRVDDVGDHYTGDPIGRYDCDPNGLAL